MSGIDNAYRNTRQEGLDLILGLGASGNSCARFLHRQGRDLRLADSRESAPFASQLQELLPDAELTLGGFDVHLLDGVGRVIVSPGIASGEAIIQEAMARNLAVISDIELFAQAAPAPVLGITGSNGKSTVTSWIAHVLEAVGYECRAGGNLGTPALDLLDAVIPDYYILELSSFQLERTHNLHLKCGAILNIGIDHLDHHGTLARYRQAKWQMLHHCETAVLYAPLAETPEFARLQDSHPMNVIRYAEQVAENIRYHLIESSAGTWLGRDGNKLFPASVLKVVGQHNYLNALAVLAMAEACDVQPAEVLEGLTSFTGLPHRMQWIGERRGVNWINDSKGTNVEATCAALRSLSTPLVLIAGGDGKNADFSALAATLGEAEVDVRAVILIGADAPRIHQALGQSCNVLHASDMADAVRQAAGCAQVHDTVLLSPACASFDMFRNYLERGEAFMHAWRNLP